MWRKKEMETMITGILREIDEEKRNSVSGKRGWWDEECKVKRGR